MILAVDAGNSNIVLGCMEGLEIRHTLRLKTDRAMSAAGYTVTLQAALAQAGFSVAGFEGGILSSVVAAVTEPLRQALRAAVRPCSGGGKDGENNAPPLHRPAGDHRR